jgi:hypothetical protein
LFLFIRKLFEFIDFVIAVKKQNKTKQNKNKREIINS